MAGSFVFVGYCLLSFLFSFGLLFMLAGCCCCSFFCLWLFSVCCGTWFVVFRLVLEQLYALLLMVIYRLLLLFVCWLQYLSLLFVLVHPLL